MQPTKENSALVWFTNNLRVHDNRMLNEACEKHERVIAAYCIDPDWFKPSQFGFHKMGQFRVKFLLESLEELALNLDQINISLLVLIESAASALPKLIESYQIDAVYHQEEWTFEELRELEAVKASVQPTINFYSYYDQFLIAPEELQLESKAIPIVFTQFRKWVEKRCKPKKPLTARSKKPTNLLKSKPSIPSSIDLGFEPFERPINSAFPFKGGELQALNRIEDYFLIRKN